MFQRLSGAVTVTFGLYLYLLITGVLVDSTSLNKVSIPLLSELLNQSEVDYIPNSLKKKPAGENFTQFLGSQFP